MPHILLPIPNVDASVSRPVNMDILRQVFKSTGLREDTPIFYPGDTERAAQLGSQISGSPDAFKFTGHDKVTIEVIEEPIHDMVLCTAVYRAENLPAYKDEALDAFIRPILSATSVTFNVKYRATDRVRARRWRDDIRARISMMRDVYLHTITYSYQIPPEFMVILEEIHRLREKQAGYGEDFNTYLAKHFSAKATVATDQSGRTRMLTICETEQRVQGYFDFEEGPEIGSREDETTTWTISFTYKFAYSQPMSCMMYYPIMVHNQVISKKYRYTELPYELEDYKRSFTLSSMAFSGFEIKRLMEPMSSVSGIAVPEIDEFLPESITHKTMRVYTALVGISEGDRRTLTNVLDAGKYTFSPAIAGFLKSEVQWLNKPYQSIFNVAVYEGTSYIHESKFTVDNELNVVATVDLDLRKTYHVRVSVVTDLRLLTKEAVDRLRAQGALTNTILLGIDPTLVKDITKLIYDKDGKLVSTGHFNNNGLPITIGPGYIPRKDWATAADHINRMPDETLYRMNTVMSFFVEAFKG